MKEMRQAFKFQLMRSKRAKHLDRTINVSAEIWNKSVALHRRYYKIFKKTLKQSHLQRHLAKLRRTRFKHWMLVDSQAVQAVTDRLYRAWDAWFKHEIKRPPTAGPGIGQVPVHMGRAPVVGAVRVDGVLRPLVRRMTLRSVSPNKRTSGRKQRQERKSRRY